MKNMLKTPFGNIIIKVNGKAMDYKYEIDKRFFDNIENNVYVINYDVLNLKTDDIITFEIESCRLIYNDGDERCDTLTLENENIILGMTGYEPQYYEVERLDYCYELLDYNNGLFEYKIERNPNNYKEKFIESHCIKMNVCWINKKDYSDYDSAINLLTWF